MTFTSPFEQSTATVRLNASHSRTLLTTRNYSGPQLLRTIHGRSELTSPVRSAPPRTEKSNMDFADEADIMALPLSSDEEDGTLRTTGRAPSGSTSKRKSINNDEDSPPQKRSKPITQPTRRSKRAAQSPEPEPIPSSSTSVPDFLSQSSQQKKRKLQYSSKIGSSSRPASQQHGFTDPGEIPSTPRKSQGRSFQVIDEVPSSRRRTPHKRLKELDIPSSAEKIVETSAAFKMPDVLGLPESSSTSTELSKLFDTGDSPLVQSRKRSSSSSSLSSIDSIASYELDQRQKDELRDGISSQGPVPKGCVRCPLCQHLVNLSTLSSKSDPNSKILRKQQAFCQTHRMNDAQAEWQAKNYPTIDWTLLEQKRISKHIPHLRQILYRKTPSFYLDHLEAEIKSARGNQSKIRRYLANEIVEVVKTGYYGPKGAKIMANTIITEMSNHLKRSLKADKTVRAVGVSGFVSAVLLPELLQQVVMEDMTARDEDEARQIISDSNEVGILVWPDDDHVVRDDDDHHLERVES